jgi:hypothetical protein
MRKFVLVLILSASLLFSCKNGRDTGDKKPGEGHIFLDYKVWGDEETNEITVKLQFRSGQIDSPTLVLPASSRVKFDGEIVAADSSKWDGAYYEIRRLVNEFKGQHNIVFTNENGTDHEEKFIFNPFTFKTPAQGPLKRGDLVFEVDGLEEMEEVEVMLSDTSYFGRGVDRLDTIRGGRLAFSKADLGELKNGPIHLEIYREQQKPLKDGRQVIGRLYISYRISREFELTD